MAKRDFVNLFTATGLFDVNGDDGFVNETGKLFTLIF